MRKERRRKRFGFPNLKSLNLGTFDWLGLGVILFTTLLLVLKPLYFFQDDWYHIKVAQVILDSGRIPTWNFWEYAPVGRPHLYPPLLPVIMALLSFMTADVFAAAMLIKTFTYPLMLLSFWYVSRRLGGSVAGFVTVLGILSVLPLLFMFISVMPASLALVVAPFVLYFFLQKRFFATAALLSISLWLHIVMPVVLVIALGLFAVMNSKKYLEFFVKVFLLSSITYAPWALHILLNIHALTAVSTPPYVTLPLVIWAVSMPGIALSLKERKESMMLLCYLFALTILLQFYGHRFWAYVILPISFFAGVTIDRLMKSRKPALKNIGVSLIVVVALTSLVAAPGIYQGHDTTGPIMEAQQTAFSWLAGIPSNPGSLNVIDPRLGGMNEQLEAASTWLGENTESGETIAIMGIYGTEASLVSVLSGRNVTSGAWRETMDDETLSSIREFAWDDAETFLIYFPARVQPNGLINIKFSSDSSDNVLTVKAIEEFGRFVVSRRHSKSEFETARVTYIYHLV
jgi:hypothetical protein